MQVYLDYASTTPLIPEVRDAMIEVMNEVHGNPSSIHSFGRKAKTLVEEARKQIAESLNCSLSELFFTAGATESNNMILRSAVTDLNVTRIISSKIEHHCILHTLEDIQKSNPQLEIIYLKVNQAGQISAEALKELLSTSDKKTLVSIMHANNEIGTMIDMDAIAELCSLHGALFHSDIAQSFGKYHFDVQKTAVHFLSASAHKLYGPKGTGFVYIQSDNQITPLLFGGSQERNMRAGTENVAGICGFAKATTVAYNQLEERHNKTESLRNYFESEVLKRIPGAVINGTRTEGYLYNVASISFPQHEHGELMVFNLDISGIAISSGSACSSGVEKDSHVLQAIGHDPKRKTIRFSFSHLNTKEEIDYTLEKLESICK